MNKDIERIKMKALPILKKHGVVKAGIFGSYARGDNKKNSDIDILVLPPNGIGFGFFGIQSELEKKLKKRVDLLSYRAIHPLLKERILKEEVKIL
jgi:predicted nucleotidyltransferase